MGDSNCIHFSGSGSAAQPFVATPVIDPSPDNLLTCGPEGLLAQLPTSLLSVPAAKLTRDSQQTIPDSTDTFVVWNVEQYDTDSIHSPASPTRLTVQTEGLYLVIASIIFGGGTSGARSADIYQDGVLVTRAGLIIAASGRLNVQQVFACVPGSYFQISVYQSSGGPLQLDQGTSCPFVSLTRLGGGP